mgnify:CR=1 FL=1
MKRNINLGINFFSDRAQREKVFFYLAIILRERTVRN